MSALWLGTLVTALDAVWLFFVRYFNEVRHEHSQIISLSNFDSRPSRAPDLNQFKLKAGCAAQLRLAASSGAGRVPCTSQGGPIQPSMPCLRRANNLRISRALRTSGQNPNAKLSSTKRNAAQNTLSAHAHALASRTTQSTE